MSKWSPQDIAVAYLTSATQQEAAERLGRSVRWLTRRLADPEVQVAIDQVKSEFRTKLLDVWIRAGLLALTRLMDVLNSPTASDSAKVDAARVVLQSLVRVNSVSSDDVVIV